MKTADADDGLRLYATIALKQVTGNAAIAEAMEKRLEDGNGRIRLIAASSLLSEKPSHEKATATVKSALSDSADRIRRSAIDLVASLGLEARFADEVTAEPANRTDGISEETEDMGR